MRLYHNPSTAPGLNPLRENNRVMRVPYSPFRNLRRVHLTIKMFAPHPVSLEKPSRQSAATSHQSNGRSSDSCASTTPSNISRY